MKIIVSCSLNWWYWLLMRMSGGVSYHTFRLIANPLVLWHFIAPLGHYPNLTCCSEETGHTEGLVGHLEGEDSCMDVSLCVCVCEREKQRREERGACVFQHLGQRSVLFLTSQVFNPSWSLIRLLLSASGLCRMFFEHHLLPLLCALCLSVNECVCALERG